MPYQPQPQNAALAAPQPTTAPVTPAQAAQTASEPLDDAAAEPRLTLGGRTELSGLNAIMFVILVIVAFVAGAFLLFNFISIGAGPATPPPSLPTALPTANATPASSAQSPGVSEPAGQTILPSLSALNLPGDPVNVIVDGNVVGTVTVKELKWPAQIKGESPPAGALWLTAEVTYDATEGDITYSASDWTLVDSSNAVIAPSTAQKAPALGAGTVTDGNKLEGIITYLVPADTTVVLHYSSGNSEADFKVRPK